MEQKRNSVGVGGMKDRANFKGYAQGSGLGYFASVCKIGTKERDIGTEREKSINFGHSHEILGRASY